MLPKGPLWPLPYSGPACHEFNRLAFCCCRRLPCLPAVEHGKCGQNDARMASTQEVRLVAKHFGVLSKRALDHVLEYLGNQMSTLFSRLGGSAAVDAAVDIFYDKVLADERIRHFFAATDMARQRAHQKAFLTFAFGGPNTYRGRDLRSGHQRLVEQDMNDSHFDAVVENLAATLCELGVATKEIQEVAIIAEGVRADVLGR